MRLEGQSKTALTPSNIYSNIYTFSLKFSILITLYSSRLQKKLLKKKNWSKHVLDTFTKINEKIRDTRKETSGKNNSSTYTFG